MDAQPDPELTVYFDGACPLCSAEIAYYARQPGAQRIAFVDIAQPGAGAGDGLAREDALRRLHVRLADGRLISGAAAFAAIWRTLPAWRWAGRLAATPPARVALEAAYRLFLPLRPSLSRVFGALVGKRA